MKHLAKLQHMFFTWQLQIPAHEHNHTIQKSRRLAVHSGDVVLALLESEPIELVADGLSSFDLLPFERQHGTLLIQPNERRPVRIESVVVVLHKGLAEGVRVHFRQFHTRSIPLSASYHAVQSLNPINATLFS